MRFYKSAHYFILMYWDKIWTLMRCQFNNIFHQHSIVVSHTNTMMNMKKYLWKGRTDFYHRHTDHYWYLSLNRYFYYLLLLPRTIDTLHALVEASLYVPGTWCNLIKVLPLLWQSLTQHLLYNLALKNSWRTTNTIVHEYILN